MLVNLELGTWNLERLCRTVDSFLQGLDWQHWPLFCVGISGCRAGAATLQTHRKTGYLSLSIERVTPQIDLFDHKPALKDRFGTELPDSIRKGQRLTGMTSTQASFPVAPSKFKFARHGQSGAWVSELLPHTSKIVDSLCFVKSLHTEAINHDPAITFMQTGAQSAGRPSFGSWISYGLGTSNRDLPAFVVLVSQGSGNPPTSRSTIGSGPAAFFLPIIRESNSARRAIRFCFCRIRRESANRADAGCSTIWAN